MADDKRNAPPAVTGGDAKSAAAEVVNGVSIPVPEGVTSVSVAGQEFKSRNGIVVVPVSLSPSVNVHFKGLSENARLLVEAAERKTRKR